MIEWMMDFIKNVGIWLMKVLPTSPFADFIENFEVPQYVAWLNWFFPVHEIVIILTGWLAAIAVFYAYSIIMRWVKIIGD